MIQCQDVMRSAVVVCRETDPVEWVAALMRDFDVSFLPVTDRNGTLVGVITARDLVARVVAEGRSASTEAREVMTRRVALCRTDDALRDVEEMMFASGRSRLAVVDANGAFVGVVELGDVVLSGRFASRRDLEPVGAADEYRI